MDSLMTVLLSAFHFRTQITAQRTDSVTHYGKARVFLKPTVTNLLFHIIGISYREPAAASDTECSTCSQTQCISISSPLT